MERTWSFGRKIGLGFAGMVMVTVLTSLATAVTLTAVLDKAEQTLSVHARLVMLAKDMDSATEKTTSAMRGYLLVPDEATLAFVSASRKEFLDLLPPMQGLISGQADEEAFATIVRREADYWSEVQRFVQLRQSGISLDSVASSFQTDLRPKARDTRNAIDAFTQRQETLLDANWRETVAWSRSATLLATALGALAILAGSALAFGLTRALKRQIGSAVQHIRSSSTELQSAASQQASGSREQATAMNEITVTVQELLATSKQIAESAQRVARIAEETAANANNGNQTVEQAQEAISGIKRQVDLIVSHMLDLGRKSQQIGGILDIINELAEQTNILAINATIEAAGAGESGRRFGTVADEIRKLADRVGNSTKEIRGLIEEVRAAVHTTIMATENGVKTVETGTRQFGELASGFRRIVSMVGTTTEAAREIGLSTKQQSTAVEQVNIATANVAQASKEAETSALQTVQTASDLARLSQTLLQLVQTQAKG
ncbi:HAMP domain-containing methyl-accepting chemotaxis protein [Azospirillum agricola]|uniref:HAMP domain-containing methyl-accepting chemotaxis protein n=1 Tax=Azospirillum agricola TaxID=1720247 RepID=UPI000A0F3E9D|nr:methyl-accepting chemotaxis protein [Azospirillum agricola]SMH46644.1 Methyl-accepting chemotaxis protein (MCP) signalling domain-containing protein [Azospirillum lipoferum]